MLARARLGLALLFVLGAAHGTALAQEANPTPPTAESPAGDVADWIKELDADRFTDRQAASDKLIAAGARAIPALIEAAQTGSPETAARAVNVLAEHLKNADADTKAAAKTALENLAESKNAVAARRAKAALEDAEKPKVIAVDAFGQGANPFGNRIQVRGGQIQIQVQANNGVQVRRVAVANNNGVKEINAEENGRKVKIKDDPQNGIEMEVTETKDGKSTTQKYKAKNAADLKQKHPDAHKLYAQYAGQAQVQVQAAGNAARRGLEIRIDALQRMIESYERTLPPLENELGKEKLKAVQQHFDNMKKELAEAKKKLAEEEEKKDEPKVQDAAEEKDE